jgi:hypothetical protein
MMTREKLQKKIVIRLIETCYAYNYMFCSKHLKCSYLDVYDLELVIQLSRRV